MHCCLNYVKIIHRQKCKKIHENENKCGRVFIFLLYCIFQMFLDKCVIL